MADIKILLILDNMNNLNNLNNSCTYLTDYPKWKRDILAQWK